LETIRIKINDHDLPARVGATILEATRESYAARQFNIKVPTLYYLKDVNETDLSGVCVVEVNGTEGLVNACSTQVAEGMEIYTMTPNVLAARKTAVESILKVHDHDCKNCFRTGHCELQELLRSLHIADDPATAKKKVEPVDESAIIVRDTNKCVRCGRCVAMCSNIQGIDAIAMVGEGLAGKVGPKNATSLNKTNCVNCGQCIAVCPVGALRERDDTDAIIDAINDPNKFVIIQAAPSVRAGIGEAFSFPVGVNTEGKLAAALRALGFDRVFDTKFSADLTIMEEAKEFIDRVKNGGVLPMATSCCPAWVKYCEQSFPEMLPNVSSCKSPQQMFGAIAKSYLAEREGIDKENIVVVSAMPCTAKKFELTRNNQSGAGVQDVDYSITNRELSRMIERAGIEFTALADETFDEPLGLGSGAGVIFGATGGVMEAALRTAADWLTGESLPEFTYTEVRGIKGIKEASYTIAGKEIKVAVVSGLSNAKELLHNVKSGKAAYDFIEVMACPGGCVNGGGQPQQFAEDRALVDIRAKRAEALYTNDEKSVYRKSHDNPAIKDVYSSYLGEPGSEKAHTLLHTSYKGRMDAKRMPQVTVNQDACQGCKSCFKTCVYGVYRWDKKANVSVAAYPEECVACLQCAMNCPANCIKVIPPAVAFYDPLYDPFGLND